MKNSDAIHHVIDDIMCSDLTSAHDLNLAFATAHKKTKNFLAHGPVLLASWFDTKLGVMIAIADHCAIHMLGFFDQKGLVRGIKRLCAQTKSTIAPGMTSPMTTLERELDQYFSKTLKEFRTPIVQHGTLFQMAAWRALRNIPYGETCSYKEQASAIGHPTAYRAVANANAGNQIAILVPCHRVIKGDGSLGGYGGLIHRKRWLLDLERN